MTKRTLTLVFALGIAMGLALSVSPAVAGPRPGSDLDLFTRLNGEQTRDLNAVTDGGGLTLFTFDAGIGCQTVLTGKVYEMHCDSAVHFCAWSDGGCSTAINSQAYGRPVNASTPTAPYPFFFTTAADFTAGATKQVCMTPASGDPTAICALFRLQ